MNIIDTEIPSIWFEGSSLTWVTSVANERSDGGAPAPVPRQTRPLQQYTVNLFWDDVVTVENLYILCNGAANGFFGRPPIERYYKRVGQSFGNATGSLQSLQFQITRGQTWNAKYPVDGTIIVMANGTPLIQNTDWTLGLLGAFTVTGPTGQALTADFQYKTAFQFVDDELQIDMQANFEAPQQVTFREIP